MIDCWTSRLSQNCYTRAIKPDLTVADFLGKTTHNSSVTHCQWCSLGSFLTIAELQNGGRYHSWYLLWFPIIFEVVGGFFILFSFCCCWLVGFGFLGFFFVCLFLFGGFFGGEILFWFLIWEPNWDDIYPLNFLGLSRHWEDNLLSC